jgi:hypothetical protein
MISNSLFDYPKIVEDIIGCELFVKFTIQTNQKQLNCNWTYWIVVRFVFT